MLSSSNVRPRRLRRGPAIRALVREVVLNPRDLVLPLFVSESVREQEPIESMPGVYRYSVERACQLAVQAWEAGILGVLLFGIPEHKDHLGSSAWHDQGAVQRTVRLIAQALPYMVVMTDVCICQYADHGHCGVVEGSTIDNDATLPLLGRIALSHARAGAHFVAPAAMMDNQVSAIRQALDEAGYVDTGIMSYSSKFLSGFYGPFRDAASSAPGMGDRSSYQMDPANAEEAVREARLDLQQGADLLMVKPALAYLDVIYRISQALDAPLVAYNVSGEYSLVKLAAQHGLIDERTVVLEALTGMKRAGADIIISYHALDAARWLRQEG